MDGSGKPLGNLTRVDARLIWQHEALDFTPWLKDNIDALADALAMELELPDIEVPVGDFSCDIVALEIGTGNRVIIENQLEPTDHGHLGQVLTYAAGLDARSIVWIAPQFRPEHRQAIDWLNSNTAENLVFFGVEVELLQIDQSPYAPHFKVVALPNDWQKAVKARSDAPASGKGLAYQQFFAEFLVRYKSQFPSHRMSNKAQAQNWLTVASAGKSGFAYYVTFDKDNRFRVELYIDVGDRDTNKSAFDYLEEERNAIEQAIGASLTWDRLDDKKGARISAAREGRIADSDSLRNEHIEWAIATIVKFRSAFAPRIKQLPL